MLNTKVTEIESKIPDITNLATKVTLDTKTAEVDSNIHDFTNLATKPALNTKAIKIENELSYTIGFVVTFELNRLTKINSDAKMKEAVKNLAIKSQVQNALDISDKIEKKLKKNQTSDLNHFNSRTYFENDGLENYLIFQPSYNTFTRPAGDTETLKHEYSKNCQMKSLSLLLHQVIFLIQT